ncbi:sigma-54-dependent Fis family transcriptional regulator [Sinanaerobacter chloroacetimidivorans]|uniref:Sigma 54-interacting transcriptional regulator n=1 Tax=Sinanaerobacter chloroacetimidivorans TaxID=2818044 RepID=A0A8J7VZA9_9FIRM|nr:sigma 54-interacting transcriptional regulator [Sinanaerobacter chloroacetimidivorans]MBR0597897.1 sigma 54-interacting transcriptional regulator [Sinanaerobacter chloroacetimidivorans]
MSFNPFYNIENPELMGYEYAWVNFIKNDEIPENIISEEIFKSWKRCKDRKQDARVLDIPENFCGHDELNARIKRNSDLLGISSPIMRDIINVLDEKEVGIRIVDSDNIVLMDVRGDGFARDNRGKSSVGDCCGESVIGTNSLALTILHQKPISVVGAQHYYQQNHRFAGYSAPIIDGDSKIRGAIGITIKLEQISHYMLAMVTTAAKVIENELQLLRSNSIIYRQNNEKQDILDSVTDGIIYVDKAHIITHANLQIAKFTGLKKDDLIGKNINIIHTFPHIGSLDSSGDISNIQVKLKGKEKSYNCFLSHKAVKDNEGSVIWIFTATDEIQELADKINLENRAFFTFDNIVGKSKVLKNCIELAQKVAEHETRVIIEGESGTGKEMFAQSIHNLSPRKNGPFVAVDCGAIPRELLESEIFGYEEGAYTGARKGGHRGKFELSHGGTLFLDEIGNLPLDMQAKLLRVLQESRVVRIGGYMPIPVNVQVIAATNQDLKKEVDSGTFREDLYYRLNIVRIKLPSLRERKEDLPMLIDSFIRANKHQINSKIKGIEEDAMNLLLNYSWPGNVRQLNNVIERMMILAEGELLTKNLIPNDIALKVQNTTILGFEVTDEIYTLEMASAIYTKKVVTECKGNIKRASEKLGISRATVYRLLKHAGGRL